MSSTVCQGIGGIPGALQTSLVYADMTIHDLVFCFLNRLLLLRILLHTLGQELQRTVHVYVYWGLVQPTHRNRAITAITFRPHTLTTQVDLIAGNSAVQLHPEDCWATRSIIYVRLCYIPSCSFHPKPFFGLLLVGGQASVPAIVEQLVN
jgi:hypothetical protein